MKPQAGSVTALSFTLAVSMSANVTWAARDGDLVSIAAGIVTPILLVMAVHQWRAHMDVTGWRKALRLLAMSAVTGTAAAWTWVHTTRLLLAHDLETPLAVAAPLAVDGLAVMATMALWPAASRSTEAVTDAVTGIVPVTVMHFPRVTTSAVSPPDTSAPQPAQLPAPPDMDVTPCPTDQATPTIIDTRGPAEMNRIELRAACRDRGLSQQGTVADMRARLLEGADSQAQSVEEQA